MPFYTYVSSVLQLVSNKAPQTQHTSKHLTVYLMLALSEAEMQIKAQ